MTAVKVYRVKILQKIRKMLPKIPYRKVKRESVSFVMLSRRAKMCPQKMTWWKGSENKTPRIAAKALKNLLVKKYKQAEELSCEKFLHLCPSFSLDGQYVLTTSAGV